MAFSNYSFIAGSMCQTGDRYLRTGYKPEAIPLTDVIAGMGKSGLARGVELHCRGNETDDDISRLADAVRAAGLCVTAVNTWTYGQLEWRYGSLSAADADVRKAALDRSRAAIRMARRLGAPCVGLWLGQDGHDYVFQTDYRAQWLNLLESMQILCDEAPDLQLGLEPKAREPRNHSLIDTVQTALLMRLESGRDNLGVVLDVGHSLCCGQAIGPGLEAALRYGCLYDMHFNDNLGVWDDDMIVGSVRLNEMLETFYLLKKYDYRGPIAVDIFPYRENPFDAVCESIRAMMTYDAVVDRLGVKALDALIAEGDVPKTLAALRRAAFGVDV